MRAKGQSALTVTSCSFRSWLWFWREEFASLTLKGEMTRADSKGNENHMFGTYVCFFFIHDPESARLCARLLVSLYTILQVRAWARALNFFSIHDMGCAINLYLVYREN